MFKAFIALRIIHSLIGRDLLATRLGPDRYAIEGVGEVRTVGCTVSADRHPVRLSGPDARHRRWVRFVGEGDPCEVRETSR